MKAKLFLAFLAGVVVTSLCFCLFVDRTDTGPVVSENDESQASQYASARVQSDPGAGIGERREPLTGGDGVSDGAASPDAIEPGPPSESEVELGTQEIDAEFYRNLRGAGRDRFFQEHRWDYIKTRRDFLISQLEKLEQEENPARRREYAENVASQSICILMDIQNRAGTWEPGVPVIHEWGQDGWFSLISNNWVYRMHEDEFPEWAYFARMTGVTTDPSTGELHYESIPAHIHELMHYRAGIALDQYRASAPAEYQ